MTPLPSDARRAVALLYLAAGIVILEALTEVFALVYPFHPNVASWRFGLLGVTLSRTAAFALADVMILGAAIVLEHRVILRVAGILHLLGAVVLLPVMVLYGLDWLVLRRALKQEFVRGFDLTAARTLLLCGVCFLAGVLVFWATYRIGAPRADRKEVAREALVAKVPVGEIK